MSNSNHHHVMTIGSNNTNVHSPTTTTAHRRSKKSWQRYSKYLLYAIIVCIKICIGINIYLAISFQDQLSRLIHLPSNMMSSRLHLGGGMGGMENDGGIADGSTNGAGNNGNNGGHDNSKQTTTKSNENGQATATITNGIKSHYTFDRTQAERALSQHGHQSLFQPLRAYIERPLNDTVPNTIDTGNLKEKKPKVEVGRPGKWYVPLPLRTGGPEDVSVFFFSLRIVFFYSWIVSF